MNSHTSFANRVLEMFMKRAATEITEIRLDSICKKLHIVNIEDLEK